MKPLYLSIEGINSFINKQEVDFERLYADNIFCICGATGAGKTTILDSIILALYGDGNRADTISDYISLDAEKAEIVFRFEFDERVWEVKRAFTRKGAGKCYLSNVTDNVIAADRPENVDRAIYSLIKLGRAEFTQVVILEQGKFAKFLSAKKTDRSSTVCRLFSLFKYESLQKKAGSVADRFAAKLGETQKALGYFESVSAEALSEKTELLAALKNDEIILSKRRGELLKMSESYALSKRKHEEYKMSEESVRVLEGRLNALNDERAKLNAENERIKAQTDAVFAAKKSIEKSSAILLDIERQKQQRSYYDNKGRELESRKGLKQALEKKVEELKNKCADARRAADLRYAELIGAAKELTFEFDVEIIPRDGDFSHSQFDGIFERLNGVEKTLHLDCNRKLDLKKKYAAANERLRALRLRLDECEKRCGQLQSAFDDAVKYAARAEDDAGKARAESEKAAVLNMAAHIGGELNKGDRCPVCGGTFEECVSRKDDGFSALRADAERLAKLAAAADKERERAGNALSVCGQELKSLLSELDGAAEETNKIKAEFESVLTFGGVMSHEGYAKNIAAAGLIRTSLTALVAQTRSLEALKSETELSLSALRSETELAGALQAELDRYRESVKNTLGGDIDTAERNALDTKAAAEVLVARHESDAERLREQITESDKRSAVALSELAGLRAKMKSGGDCAYDADGHQRTDAELEDCNAALKGITASVAVAESEITALKNGLEQKNGLLKERKFYTDKHDLAERLKKLFRGNRFLEYIEEDYIQKFTVDASKRLFELSNGKYRLEYGATDKRADFFVVDYLSGGKRRNVKTLSGGETFLASLSLAMAISSHISMEKSYGFFFLDEGFGTLDEDTVGIVASALYKLAEQTLVGVVSHRSELVERIPVRLRVSPPSAGEGCGSEVHIENA